MTGADRLDAEVVIVGAGPTGVTAAILLGQAGVRTLVLDRWTDVFAQPRAVHLDDEVRRVLGRLGVEKAFADITVPGAGLRLLAPDHRTLAQFDRRTTDDGLPQANMFDQPELERLLRERMAQLPSVTFVGDVEVVAARAADDVCEVDLVGGADRDPRTVRARFVLGCDGANSLVRRSIGASMRPLGLPAQRWLVVDIATPRELGHWDGVHQVCDSRRAATYMRIGPRRHRWEFELLAHETAADYATRADLAPLLAPWETHLDDLEVLRLAEYTFRAELADRWRRDGLFILGDAAHLTPPFIGQGMGAGIRDAANLAWKIAAVLDGTLPSAVLDSYEAERRPHARAMIRRAVAVGWSMTGGGRVGDLLRVRLVPGLMRLPGVRGVVLDSATPPLASSSLVQRGRGGRGLAGTLCPNAELGSGERLDDVARGGFLLLHRGAPPAGAALASDPVAPGVRVVDVSADPVLARWLDRCDVALVRPDATVAVAGTAREVVAFLADLR